MRMARVGARGAEQYAFTGGVGTGHFPTLEKSVEAGSLVIGLLKFGLSLKDVGVARGDALSTGHFVFQVNVFALR